MRETFQEMSQLEGSDDGARSLRCVMWTRDPDPADDTYVVEFAFLLRDGTAMRAVHDQHVEGLFARAKWHDALGSAGYQVETIVPLLEEGRAGDLFLCRRP